MRQASNGEKPEKDFTETEIESQSIMKARMSQGNNRNVNKKQKQTQDAVKRESAGQNDDRKKMVTSISTLITHNKGGRWELIKAPTIDSEGKKVNCYLDEDCSLHLQIYSSDGLFAPPYSQDSAVGLIIGVGNVGERLDRALSDRMSTYLSRDGGLTWAEVRKGPYIYELGDHGGLIQILHFIDKLAKF